MSLPSWLSWTFSPSHARRAKRRNRATTASKRRGAYRPRLEALEDRCLLNGGALDPTFGNGGLVTTGIGPDSVFDGVAIQPDGKIVAAGGNAGDFAVARYLASAPSFVITGPSGVTAGTAGSFTLTALNADGTSNTSYSGTAQITSSDP